MKKFHQSDLWTIGGFDPSGGAGITSDLATFQNIGLQASALITTLTSQSPLEFCRSYPVERELFRHKWETTAKFAKPTTIKLGMLGSEEIIEEVSLRIKTAKKAGCSIIVDPVFKASHCDISASKPLVAAFKKSVLPHAFALTPNAQEAFELTGIKVVDRSSQIAAAKVLRAAGAKVVVIKGGHIANEDSHLCSDYYLDGYQSFFMTTKRLNKEVHGTGCVFASAFAAYLYLGEQPHNAAIRAKHFVSAAIYAATVNDAGSRLIQFPKIALDERCFPVVDFHDKPEPVWSESPSCSSELGLYGIVSSSSQVAEYARRGLKTVQLRIKDSPAEQVVAEVRKSVQIAQQYGMQLFVNDYWQIAIDEKAYGIHLGQEDLQKLSCDALAGIKAANLRLGISTHEPLELARALAVKPSYVALGPIFETTCKSMRFGPHGLAKIGEWTKLTKVPVVAIGGLKCTMLEDIKALGAGGLAVISDLPNC